MKPRFFSLWVALIAWFSLAWTFAHAQIGTQVQNPSLSALGGGQQPLLVEGKPSVLLFVKPGQEHSHAVLGQLAALQRELAAKPLHWVAIISDRVSKADMEKEAREAGLAMPVLIDARDAVYGSLGVILHPVVCLVDKEGKLAAFEHFTKVNFIEVVRARIRRLLNEITDQDLEKVLKPAKATQGGDEEVGRRRLKLAEKLLQAGHPDQALESVKKSLEMSPKLAAAHTLQGRILAAQGKRAEAIQAFTKALELDPGDTAARDGLKASQKEP